MCAWAPLGQWVRSEQHAIMPSRKAPRRKVNAARREATQQEKRLYAKQFLEAKHGEIKSWTEENDVYELVDMRKLKVQNFITGRWVLTIKRDNDGNFSKRKEQQQQVR